MTGAMTAYDGETFRDEDRYARDLAADAFTDCTFVDADLSESDLSGTSPRGSDLSRATVRRAVLHRADLRGAVLDAVDLEPASLSETRLDLAGSMALAERHGAIVG